MKKFCLMVLLLAFTFTSVLSGCGGGDTKDGAKPGTAQTATDSNKKITLLIWHDKGDAGINMFKEIGDLFNKKYPNVQVESITFPAAQFIEKSIAAINTNSAPDIFWNDYHRIIPIEQQTGKLIDMADKISGEEKTMIGNSAMLMGVYANKQIVYPNETAYIALGIRKSWLEKVKGKVPETIDEFVELAKKFVKEDPDGNGKNDTYGFTGYFGKGSLEFLRYFDLASGLNNYVVNEKGEPAFNEDNKKKILAKYAAMYNTDKIVPDDSVSHTFIEMYQLIEGGRVGMFRVGDWNVKKWNDMFNGDFILAPFPVLNKGDKPTAQVYTVRGSAVAQNSPNMDMTIKFTQFMNEKESQMIHFKYQADIIRTDLKPEGLSENQKYFFDKIRGGTGGYKVVYPDTYSATYAYVPKIEELYEKAIQNVISDKNVNIDKLIGDTEKQAADIVKAEKK